MTTLYTNIQFLVSARDTYPMLRGDELATLPIIEQAYLLIENDLIAGYGLMADLDDAIKHKPAITINTKGATVMPCWVDSHSHIVYAGSRENEFLAKLKGASYAEIAANGGGILSSATLLASTSEEDLLNDAHRRLMEVIAQGTGALEIKSGYGLSVAGELKMLRVIKKLKAISPIPIKATFLGAHAIPQNFKHNKEGYVSLIVNEMLPAIARENLADYVDVFCEEGFFTAADTDMICKAALQYNLQPKLHVNQLNSIGGISAGIQNNALSLDHLETLTTFDIEQLGKFKGCCTLLPSAAFFLRMPPPEARKLINAGAAITLASDYNPGSSPSGNMNFVTTLGCIQLKMLPEEVINAATINGAYAMGLQHELGSITVGKKANLIFTHPVPNLAYLFYSFGTSHIQKVMINGDWIPASTTDFL